MKKCTICGTKLESKYEYCPNCGGSTKEIKIRKLPIRKLVAFNLIGGILVVIALGLIGLLIILIVDLIVWYRSPQI